MGADCISTVRPLFPSETTFLPLLGERGLYTLLLSGAWHLPPFVALSQVTYGKGLLINMQKLVLGAYLQDFTS